MTVWRPLTAVAHLLGRPRQTLVAWTLDLTLPACCDVQTRRLHVDLARAAEINQTRTRRAA